jgi:hypothetical protein
MNEMEWIPPPKKIQKYLAGPMVNKLVPLTSIFLSSRFSVVQDGCVILLYVKKYILDHDLFHAVIHNEDSVSVVLSSLCLFVLRCDGSQNVIYLLQIKSFF